MSPIDLRAARAHARDQRPFANGTEYELWSGHWCSRCARDAFAEHGAGCPLLTIALLDQRTPAEWFDHEPGDRAERYRCIEFRSRGGGGDPEPRPRPEPNQSGLFGRPSRTARMLATPAEVSPAVETPSPAFCDPVIVERLLRGREPLGRRLTHAERLEAIRRKDEFRLSPHALATRMGLNSTTFRRLQTESARFYGSQQEDSR